MSKRVHGKAGFSDIHDRYGKIQLYIKIDDVGEEKLKEYKTFDIGDFVSITGTVFKTKTGEVTLHIVDRKSTRLNSSHANISYAVFCLKKQTHLDSSINHVS